MLRGKFIAVNAYIIKEERSQINNLNFHLKNQERDFPGGAMVKNPPANAGDTGSIPGLGRSHMPRSN